MRRITLWLLSTAAGLVLLFSYRTSTGGGVPVAGAGAAGGEGEGFTATAPPSTAPSGSSGGTVTGTTYRGPVTQTRWGPVQVTITVAAGRITKVAVPVYPNGNGRDAEINGYALPILTRETLSAQSAGIDTVSGATVTSDGYIHSLQAAVDAAHLR